MKQKIMISGVSLVCLFILSSNAVSSASIAYQTRVSANPVHLSLEVLMDMVNTTRMEQWIQSIQGFGPHPTGSIALDDLGDFYLLNCQQ